MLLNKKTKTIITISTLVLSFCFCFSMKISAQETSGANEVLIKEYSDYSLIPETIIENNDEFYLYSIEVKKDTYEATFFDSTGTNTLTEESPRIEHSYSKTVTRTYASHTAALNLIYYEEFSSSMSTWFRGTLYLQSVVKTGTGDWIATYTGTLFGNL